MVVGPYLHIVFTFRRRGGRGGAHRFRKHQEVSDVLAGFPLPLSAVQILHVNLATDGLPALALAVDPPEPDLMRRKPRNPRVGIFTRPVVTMMLAGGLWSGLVNMSLFAWLLRAGRPLEQVMAMTFVTLVLIQFFNAYNCRSDSLGRWSCLASSCTCPFSSGRSGRSA